MLVIVYCILVEYSASGPGDDILEFYVLSRSSYMFTASQIYLHEETTSCQQPLRPDTRTVSDKPPLPSLFALPLLVEI